MATGKPNKKKGKTQPGAVSPTSPIPRSATRIVRVALIQMRCGDSPGENLSRALEKIKEAAARGASIVCLPELFRTRYFCQSEDDACFALAEPIPGETTQLLSRAAASSKVVLIGSVFERRTDGLYHNTAVTFDASGRMLGKYRKMHIPDDPCYYEKFYFTPGDAAPAFPAIVTSAARIATLVCWDQWFPEAARVAALNGAQIIFYPTAIGWHLKDPAALKQAQTDAWELIQRSHALANGCFVCAVNRVGREGELNFWGGSFVADPFGRVIARASAVGEEMLMAECDLEQIDYTRRHWPFLRDRRVDAYGGLLQRFIDSPLPQSVQKKS